MIRLYLIAGEPSGDVLGARLMRTLKQRHGAGIEFRGVGGEAMCAEGLTSLFPMQDICLMGFSAVVTSLPLVLQRIRQTTLDVITTLPQALVIIDAPDFTHRVARRVRRLQPHIPIIDYVSPTVWAWRSGRARKMRAYIDHVLAVLPFEPEAHLRLGGPPCSYVGHSLVEQMGQLTPSVHDLARREASPPHIVVLPGSRRSEIHHLMRPFGEALELVRNSIGEIAVTLPAVPHLMPEIMRGLLTWPIQPKIITTAEEKYAAFRQARAALAASGTVTLELGLCKVPTVVAYKGSWIEEKILRLITHAEHVALPNLVLGQRIMPEMLQREAEAAPLAVQLLPLLAPTPERTRQLDGLALLRDRMSIPDATPSEKAADIIESYLRLEIGT